MAITDISTRSIAEIDLAFAADYLARCQCNYQHEGESRLASLTRGTDPRFLGMGSLGQQVVFGSTPHHSALGATRVMVEPKAKAQNNEGKYRARVCIGDLASVLPSILWHSNKPAQESQLRVQYRALANWLRQVADDEPSRPILDIREMWDSSEPGRQIPVTVSPSLRNKPPAKVGGGLGHVSAALLLWLESTAADDENM